MHSRTWMILGIILLTAAGGVSAFQIVAPRVQPLPVLMALPQGALTDQDGHAFDFYRTRGRAVVLSLIYTHCPDVCPLTTANMKQLQERIRSEQLDSQVQLVTFTVDPERDNPEILKRFSGAFSVNPGNWVFLTGSPDEIRSLIKGLGIYVERVYYVDGTPVPETSSSRPAANTAYLVNHTDRVFLIDRQGQVRALSSGSQMDVDSVLSIVRHLVVESSPTVGNASQ